VQENKTAKVGGRRKHQHCRRGAIRGGEKSFEGEHYPLDGSIVSEEKKKKKKKRKRER